MSGGRTAHSAGKTTIGGGQVNSSGGNLGMDYIVKVLKNGNNGGMVAGGTIDTTNMNP
jgi:hypothetical protein